MVLPEPGQCESRSCWSSVWNYFVIILQNHFMLCPKNRSLDCSPVCLWAPVQTICISPASCSLVDASFPLIHAYLADWAWSAELRSITLRLQLARYLAERLEQLMKSPEVTLFHCIYLNEHLLREHWTWLWDSEILIRKCSSHEKSILMKLKNIFSHFLLRPTQNYLSFSQLLTLGSGHPEDRTLVRELRHHHLKIIDQCVNKDWTSSIHVPDARVEDQDVCGH